MIWLTSDQHFGHFNAIRHANRPFQDLEEMNNEIARRHNSVVAKKDLVYHLGDFAWKGQHKQFLKALNGSHHLILGNHDGKVAFDAGFSWVKDVYQLKVNGHPLAWLSHYAHRVWPQSHYGSIHCHGHSHGTLPEYGRSMDVGVDAWDYFPVSLNDVVARLGTVPVPGLNKEEE
jgi:calcineurin-like phosphoesterase family protein